MTIKEVQFDSNGEREDAYRPYESIEAAVLQTELLKKFPDALDPKYGVPELIAIHEDDGTNYFDRTCSVIFKGAPPECVQEKYDFDIQEFSDCWGFKYSLNTGEISVKAYDAQLWKHRLPAMPKGTRICEQFGVSISLGDPRLTLMRDIYFIHGDRNEVQNFYDKRVDTGEFDVGRVGLFGLLYDARSLKVIKLKQYVYPEDPKLINPRRV